MDARPMEASSGKEIFVHYHKQCNDSVESIQQRHHHRFVPQHPSLSEYAVSLPTQPADVSVVQPSDDRFKFFAKGRDFQPHWKQHKYTPEELHILETYEGSSRLPSNSLIYREWSSHHNYSSLQTIGWGIVALISLIIGVLTFGIKELCERFQIFYNPLIKDYIERGEPYKLFLYHAGMSCTFVAISAAICVFFCPWAAGSGIPEIICILNGTVVRNVLSFRTLACKIASVSFAVLSGLPLGFEGPLIHIGGMVGALVSRPASPSCGCYRNGPSFSRQVNSNTAEDEEENVSYAHPCCRYRDCEERHSLICLGAACGISSAFSAPISAILFVIEEISTHWSALLTWKAFVGCILARSTTEVIRTFAATLEKYEGFSFLQFAHSAVFYEKDLLSLNLLMVVPSVLIGVIGGFLGVLYILLNLKMAKFRRRILGKIQSKSMLQAVKIFEPVFLALLCTFVIMGTLPYFKCKPLEYEAKRYNRNEEGKFLIFRGFQCDTPLVRQDLTSKVIQTGEYHEAATLLFGSWEQMIRNLLSRRTPLVFSAPILFVVFIFFFFVSSWVSLTSIASGFLICQLAIGALYGRLLGVLAYDSVTLIKMEKDWKWLDPGAFAMLGAAAFLAGTARLPITSVVLMVEITNDINLCLLIMIVVMISKAIGDSFTHPLYHSIIEFKCIPFLELELDIRCHKKKINLDLFDISTVMASPVQCIQSCESVQKLANILLSTNHCGFPVVQARGDSKVFLGMITRMELTVLLTKTASFKAIELERECRERIRITYPDYSALRIKDTITTNMTLSNYSSNPRYRSVTVNLVPYLNTSAHSVRADMSLGRGYNMFRSLGLRHLVITDHENQVVGMITRKDLMGFVVVSKLKAILKSRSTSQVASNEQTNE